MHETWTSPRLLIDGDIEAYKAAAAVQLNIEWEEGLTTVLANLDDARDIMDTSIREHRERLGVEEVVICLSDTRNFRKVAVWDGYKANRKDVVRPVLLADCVRHLRAAYPWARSPWLEADDVMAGFAHRHPDSVIVSIDKDMKSVACRLFNPNRPDDGAVTISDSFAYWNHMLQTLAGDSSDGYSGCPGIGPKKAEAALLAALAPGETPHRFKETTKGTLWKTVLSLFEARWKDTTIPFADAALRMARLAKIVTGPAPLGTGPNLWEPPAEPSS